MKNTTVSFILTIILLHINMSMAFTQGINETRKIFITTPDSVITAYVKETGAAPKTDDTHIYYWYYAGRINYNQGGFSGKLLHGKYEVFDKQQKLLTSGYYNNGLKDGLWIKWYTFGKMKESCLFKNGKRNGALKIYTVTGTLLTESNYSNDLLDGKSLYFLRDTVIVKKYKMGKEVLPGHNRLFTTKRRSSAGTLSKKTNEKEPTHRRKTKDTKSDSRKQPDNLKPQK